MPRVIGRTDKGRPAYEGEDGSVYSEITRTIKLPNGKWLVAPSVMEDGSIIEDEDTLYRIYQKNKFRDTITGEKLRTFYSPAQADAYAAKRSKNLRITRDE